MCIYMDIISFSSYGSFNIIFIKYRHNIYFTFSITEVRLLPYAFSNFDKFGSTYVVISKSIPISDIAYIVASASRSPPPQGLKSG